MDENGFHMPSRSENLASDEGRSTEVDDAERVPASGASSSSQAQDTFPIFNRRALDGIYTKRELPKIDVEGEIVKLSSLLDEIHDKDEHEVSKFPEKVQRALTTRKDFQQYLTHARDPPEEDLFILMRFVNLGIGALNPKSIIASLRVPWYWFVMLIMHFAALCVAVFSRLFLQRCVAHDAGGGHVWTARKVH